MKHLRRINEDVITSDEKEELKNISTDLIDMGFNMQIVEEDQNFVQSVRSHSIYYNKRVDFRKRFGSKSSFNSRYQFVPIDDMVNNIEEYGDFVKELSTILPEIILRIKDLGFNIVHLSYYLNDILGGSGFKTDYVITIKIKKEYISK